MKAMILAAGQGTRLLPLTESIPKPMIPISSEPLIVHQIRWLGRAGVSDIVINLHHLGDQIRDCLGTGVHLGVKIRYSVEEELLDTGGGIVKALPLLGREPFLVLNGDVWTSYRFRFSEDSIHSRIHLVLVDRPDPESPGDFSLKNYDVERSADDAERNLVYAGISLIRPEVFLGYSEIAFSLRDVLFREVDEGNVTGEHFDGVWFDIGSHDQLKKLRRFLM